MATLRSLLANPVDDTILPSLFPNFLPEGEAWVWQATCWTCHMTDYQETCCMKWTVENGKTDVTFEIWGGGGNGAGSCCCMSGPGGGSGAYAKKRITATAGDRYDMQLAQATSCSSTSPGCRGCITWVTGNGLSNFCAEGGASGTAVCFPSCCFSMCTCGTQAVAYGGDVMKEGVRSCWWFICCDNQCWNKRFQAYPAGLVNENGGTALSGQRGNNYVDFESCSVASYIGFAQMQNQYVPGLGGGTGMTSGGCCTQGVPGRPGLVKITYK